MKEILTSFFSNQMFVGVVFCWIGAICGHVLTLYSDDFKGTKPFLEKLIPNKSSTLYFRVDFIMLPIIGGLIAYMLLDPTGIKNSFFAGISWSGSLSALLRKKSNDIINP